MDLAEEIVAPAPKPVVRDPRATSSEAVRQAPVARGARLYLIASIAAQVAALVRYVTIARLLGPSELGLAATLVVTSGFFDLISDTGADRFLIQDADGDTPRVQSLVQMVYAGRGVLIGLAMLLFAWPLSMFYGAPALTGAFMLLALAPAIGGFTHMDMRRAQRRHDFRTEAVVVLGSESASLVAIVVAAILTRNHMAIVWGLIARAVVVVLVSHLRAQRPYRLAYDKAHAGRLARYAAPLVVTGVMIFIGMQGDRVLVAQQLGVRELGLYSAVILLIFYPSAVLLRYMHALFVPLVAGVRDDPAERARISDLLGSQTLVLGVAMAAGFALVAPFAVPILYGRRYGEPILLIGLIGVLQTTRYLINWPTTVALALGKSSAVMNSNLVRLLVFPGAFAGLAISRSLAGLVGGFIAGELVSIAVAIVLLNRNLERSALHGMVRYGRFVLCAALIVGWDLALPHPHAAPIGALAVATLALIAWIVRAEQVGVQSLWAAVRAQIRLPARR